MLHPILKKKRNRNIFNLGLIGFISLLIRLLMHYEFDRSALLYVGIPFLIAMILLFIERPENTTNWKRRYVNIVVSSLIVMLGSSVVLFEGFVCVVMIMPIYFFIVLLSFIFEAINRRGNKGDHSRHYVHILPAVIFLSAFEGVVPELSFEREYSVVREKVITSSIDDIKHKLMQPIALNKSRHWLLTIFPMPYHIEAGSLNAGDIHTIDFRYHRWFVTNIHEGSMELEISEVKDKYIRTSIIKDTSYISNYLKLHGTEIYLESLENGKTKVSIKILYRRFLDPAWYFGPIQEYTVGKTAQFLLDEVITPKNSRGDI